MKITEIASNSKGNAFLVERTSDTILIDCGVKVSTEFDILIITHLHGDHAKHFKLYARTHKWTCGDKVYQKLKETVRANILDNYVEPESIGVKLFELLHDMPNYGIYIEDGEETYCHITDTDYTILPSYAKGCTYYSIESNYDLTTLEQSNRPPFLIERIKNTHMSNEQAQQMLEDVVTENTKAARLIHISGECNDEFYLPIHNEGKVLGCEKR